MLLHIVKTAIPGVILAVLLGACSSQATRQSDYFDYDEPLPDVAEPMESAPESPEPAPVRIALRDDVPDRYVVKKGDTLWDISSLFLRDPWLWPEIWYFNPQIDNPHLIYPGDILTLVYVDGKPQLRVTRDGATTVQPPDTAPAGIETVRLSPHVRTEDLKQAIPTIPLDVIGPFLVKPRVVSEEELEAAPYILSSLDRHLINASGNTVYARNFKEGAADIRYSIFRPGRVFKDPKTDKVLGYETTLVSEAKLVEPGDPATLVLTRSLRETLNGDRILPADSGRISHNFIPKAPSTRVEGQIIALVDAISHAAQRQVVVINLGEQDG
ncbi:MAG TPA: LysM peptidoglycan-binding domain-containing protein, partial [Gammaproteobacteria bacterium]